MDSPEAECVSCEACYCKLVCFFNSHGACNCSFTTLINQPFHMRANLTESQKTTETHYVLQNSNKQIQYASILLHPSSFTLPLSPSWQSTFHSPGQDYFFYILFFVDVIPLWNSLPSNFVSCPSVSNFKRNIRSHFFTSFWYSPIALFLCSCILMLL